MKEKKKVSIIEYEGFSSKEEALKWLRKEEEKLETVKEHLDKLFKGLDDIFSFLESKL